MLAKLIKFITVVITFLFVSSNSHTNEMNLDSGDLIMDLDME